MNISMNLKTDYSYLFSSMGTGTTNTSFSSNFLADYASIKSGSYGKLMKAYYSENSSDTVKSIAGKSVNKEDSKVLAKVQNATDALKESADDLLASGSKSLFNEKENTVKDDNGIASTKKGYDMEAIYKAVSSFAEDYNEVIKLTDDISSDSILSRIKSMTANTSINSKMLAKVGITVKSDNTLSVDKDTFLKADTNTVKSLFNGNGSYAYRISAQTSMINYGANREANKFNTYTFAGAYSNNLNSGNLFNSFF